MELLKCRDVRSRQERHERFSHICLRHSPVVLWLTVGDPKVFSEAFMRLHSPAVGWQMLQLFW